MTFQQFENQFREKATRAGFSEDNIIRCLNYAEPIIKKKLPVIFNTSNLSALVGYNKNYLKRAALHTPFFYRTFYIKKHNGKRREIKEPLPSLKEIQVWILENILVNIKASRYAKAYIKGKSILENVKYHKNQNVVITLDIKNFFPSIKFKSIEAIFLRCEYSPNVANLLAKLCCNDGMLPQGAPTSPALSNIFMLEFDNKIAEYCKVNGIRFTRYADDLSFSFLEEEKIGDLMDQVVKQLEYAELSLNKEKIKIMKPNTRQIITGIVTNEKIQLPREKRKGIRQEMFYIMKFGLAEHLKKTNNTKANYLKHIKGRINYGLHINPADIELKSYKEFLENLEQNTSNN